MRYDSTITDDVRLILRKSPDINWEELDRELRRFQHNDMLNLDERFFEKFRRKPERKDLLFQAVKELRENKGLKDDEIRRLIADKKYPESIDSIVEGILSTITTKDFKDYSIMLYRGSGILTNPIFGLDNTSMSDAPYQFILRDNKWYIANAGFFPYPGIIEITQIQGFSSMARNLEPLKWSRCLIRAAVDWANGAGVPEVGVKPHHQNGWEKVYYNSHGHSNLVYDVSAKREGFEYDEARKLFVLKSGGKK